MTVHLGYGNVLAHRIGAGIGVHGLLHLLHLHLYILVEFILVVSF